MKSIKCLSLLLIAGVVLILAAAGCGEQKKDPAESQMLVVKRQYVKVKGSNPDAWEFAEFSVDIPVEGPQPLLDSIKAFLNENLYKAFEAVDFDEDSTWFTPKDVYTDDMSCLLDSYVDKYSDHLKNMEWVWPSGFSFFMVAQTESFVTYGLEAYQGRAAVMYCHTFSKKDGHEVDEIITKENLLRFLKDHPDVKHPFYDLEIFNNEDVYYNLGLLEDGALCISAMQNDIVISKFGYKELLPYLSTEAQELVNTIGNTKYLYEDWSLGEEIGRVKTTNGKTVCLMQRPPLWGGFGLLVSENEDFYKDKAYTLTAYTVKDGHFVRNDEIFPTPRVEFELPNVAWEGPHFEDNDYYRFDPANNILLAPYRKGLALVDFISYKFDGKHFVKMTNGVTRDEQK